MAVNEEQITEALKEVIDPELFVNIVDLGLIYEVNTAEAEEKTNVFITMTLTSPACPSGPQMVQQAKASIGKLDGIGDVDIKMTLSPPWSPERMSDDAKDQLGIF